MKYLKKFNSHEEYLNYIHDTEFVTGETLSVSGISFNDSASLIQNIESFYSTGATSYVFTFDVGRELDDDEFLFIIINGDEILQSANSLDDPSNLRGGVPGNTQYIVPVFGPDINFNLSDWPHGYCTATTQGTKWTVDLTNLWSNDYFIIEGVYAVVLRMDVSQYLSQTTEEPDRGLRSVGYTTFGDNEYVFTGATGTTSCDVVAIEEISLGNVATPYAIYDKAHVHYSGTWGVKFSANKLCHVSVSDWDSSNGSYSDYEISYDGLSWTAWPEDENGGGLRDGKTYYATLSFGTFDHPYIWVRGNNPNGLNSDSFKFFDHDEPSPKSQNPLAKDVEDDIKSNDTVLKAVPYEDYDLSFPKVTISGNIDALLSKERRVCTSCPSQGFAYLFYNNNYIVDAKNLIIGYDTMSIGSLTYMFCDCHFLMFPPELPATTLARACYYEMFEDCINLIKAPVLPAEYIPNDAYRNMFRYCESLKYIKCYATGGDGQFESSVNPLNDAKGEEVKEQTDDLKFGSTVSPIYCGNWVYDVSETGTFYAACEALQNNCWQYNSSDGIPYNWDVIPIESDCSQSSEPEVS